MEQLERDQLMGVIQEMQRNQLVHLKLIGYLEADLDAKNNRIAQLEEQLIAELDGAKAGE